MDTPKITTVIPTYRRPRLLERAIRSVLAQTYQDFEIRVYDNASGDETARVVRELASGDPRVKYHCHAQNIGAFQNFSFGLAQVQTPFFNILSDDDLILPEFFERAMAAFAAHANMKIFGGATLWFDEAKGTIRDVPALHVPQGLHAPPGGFFNVLEHRYTDWMGMLFKSELLAELGGLDPGAGAAMDTEFICRCAARYALFVSHVPCAIYTLHRETATARNWSLRWWWTTIAYPIAKFESEAPIGVPERRRLSRLKRQLLRKVFGTGLKAVVEGSSKTAGEGIQILSEAGAWRSTMLAALGSPGVFAKLARRSLSGAEKIRALIRSVRRGQAYRPYDAILADLIENTKVKSLPLPRTIENGSD